MKTDLDLNLFTLRKKQTKRKYTYDKDKQYKKMANYLRNKIIRGDFDLNNKTDRNLYSFGLHHGVIDKDCNLLEEI